MSDEHEQAGEVYESEEVFDVVFPPRDQSTVVLHPGEDSFDLTCPPKSAQI
jgi:hypothetical protein